MSNELLDLEVEQSEQETQETRFRILMFAMVAIAATATVSFVLQQYRQGDEEAGQNGRLALFLPKPFRLIFTKPTKR